MWSLMFRIASWLELDLILQNWRIFWSRFMAETVQSPAVSSGEASGSNQLSVGVIIGICIGVSVSLLLATCGIVAFKLRRRKSTLVFQGSSGGSERKDAVLPIRVHGVNSSVAFSDSDLGVKSPAAANVNAFLRANKDVNYSAGILPFAYKDLQKATNNFTLLLGRGAFGPVYKAVRSSGPVLAVKVLDSKSKQGGKEFQTEVLLLGRLHHKNLLNLVGYCAERGRCMLVYEYMSGGSLAEHLYNEDREPLSWEARLRIAQDVSRGLEYLHDGAVPPVVHRDIKSANILLDSEMTAKVSDFGLSKEIDPKVPTSTVQGTFGYVDPEYVLTNVFTEKSDVYSFGVLLFELMSGRNPQQGLLDYVQLAALGVEGLDGWGELLDPRLNGKCNLEELGKMASIAFRCVQASSNKRPRMRDVSQWLLRIGRQCNEPAAAAAAAAVYQVSLDAVSEVHPDQTKSSELGPLCE